MPMAMVQGSGSSDDIQLQDLLTGTHRPGPHSGSKLPERSLAICRAMPPTWVIRVRER